MRFLNKRISPKRSFSLQDRVKNRCMQPYPHTHRDRILRYKKTKNEWKKNMIPMYLQSYKNQVEEDHVQLELQLWSGQGNKIK